MMVCGYILFVFVSTTNQAGFTSQCFDRPRACLTAAKTVAQISRWRDTRAICIDRRTGKRVTGAPK